MDIVSRCDLRLLTAYIQVRSVINIPLRYSEINWPLFYLVFELSSLDLQCNKKSLIFEFLRFYKEPWMVCNFACNL